MTTREIIKRARDDGFVLSVEGDRLRVQHRKAEPNMATFALIAAKKDAVRAMLDDDTPPDQRVAKPDAAQPLIDYAAQQLGFL